MAGEASVMAELDAPLQLPAGSNHRICDSIADYQTPEHIPFGGCVSGIWASLLPGIGIVGANGQVFFPDDDSGFGGRRQLRRHHSGFLEESAHCSLLLDVFANAIFPDALMRVFHGDEFDVAPPSR